MHGIPHLAYPIFVGSKKNKVSYNLSVGGGAEGVAHVYELLVQEFSIDDITIMGYGKSIRAIADYDGLDIWVAAGTSGGVTVMTNGNIAIELA